jgi:uncharacterized protein
MYWLLIIFTGILAGLFSGMFGIGGGIVIVPLLTFLTKINHFTAQGISLGALIAPVSLLALINYYKKGYVKIKEVLVIALLIIIFSYFGSKLALSLPMKLISKMFGVLLIFTGIYMVLK